MQQHLSLKALEQKLEDLRETDPKNAAVYAFVLARLHQKEGDDKQAIQFGKEAINLLGKCRQKELSDFVVHEMFIAGVAIPGLFHDNTIRRELQPLAL